MNYKVIILDSIAAVIMYDKLLKPEVQFIMDDILQEGPMRIPVFDEKEPLPRFDRS